MLKICLDFVLANSVRKKKMKGIVQPGYNILLPAKVLGCVYAVESEATTCNQ